MDRVVEQTNLYALQEGTGRSQHTNGGPNWEATNAVEMRAFFGVAILMGIKALSTICDYWKTSEFLRCSVIPRVFTQNRFESLLWCLHLVDNSTAVTDRQLPQYDKLSKVR